METPFSRNGAKNGKLPSVIDLKNHSAEILQRCLLVYKPINYSCIMLYHVVSPINHSDSEENQLSYIYTKSLQEIAQPSGECGMKMKCLQRMAVFVPTTRPVTLISLPTLPGMTCESMTERISIQVHQHAGILHTMQLARW